MGNVSKTVIKSISTLFYDTRKYIFFVLITFLTITELSCGKKAPEDLVIKISPDDSYVLDLNAYSCSQTVRGVGPGSLEGPSISGPIVLFNKMTLEWKKSTELYIAQVKFKFTSNGITGGESVCDITGEIPALFEVGRYGEQTPTDSFKNSTFVKSGTVFSNPLCRIACNIPLINKEVPEISGSGELTIKAFELTNKGAENERYYRVRSKFRVKISP